MSDTPGKGPSTHLERERLRARDTADLLAREREVRRRLERESEVRDRLVALLVSEVVAHARIVLGWSGLMRREPLDGRTRDIALQKIESSGHAQLATVEELVDVAAIAAAALRLNCGEVDLTRVVAEVAADVGPSRMSVEAGGPAEALVFADPEQLARAVRALLPTAPEAGPGTFRLALREDEGTVELHVRKAPAEARSDVHVAKQLAELYGGRLRLADDGAIVLSLPASAPPDTAA